MISNSEFNQRLLQEIGKQMPRKSQQLNFLLDEMSLGKESAYRRLRGDVPFSFTEACVISEKLDLSLDNIVNSASKNKKPTFFLHVPPHKETPDDYIYHYRQTYEIYETTLNRWLNDPTLSVYTASNIIPQTLMLSYPYLSKFRAFAWRYQMHHGTAPAKFSSISLPDDIVAKQKILVQKIKQLPESVYIVSKHIFSTIVKMIQYFFNLNLITKEEVFTIRDELLQLLINVEQLTTYERTEQNGKILVYVANIDFNSNDIYIQGKDFERSFIELHFINTISTSDPQVCRIQKEWIDSLKKYSTLISMSGSFERISFFEKQRMLINKLSDISQQVASNFLSE